MNFSVIYMLLFKYFPIQLDIKTTRPECAKPFGRIAQQGCTESGTGIEEKIRRTPCHARWQAYPNGDMYVTAAVTQGLKRQAPMPKAPGPIQQISYSIIEKHMI